MKYIIKFKHQKAWLWQKRVVSGHVFSKELDKMVLHLPDSRVEEIPEWSKCYVKLGQDFFLAQKEAMENESGVDVKLKGV